MSFFEPDRYFSRISAIDIQKDIIDQGFTHILLDVDNTILRRDTHEVPRDVKWWLTQARQAGLKFCLVSNNWHHGVYDLADELDLPIVAKAIKPLPHAFVLARRKIGAKRKTTLMIGDQLMTDVLGAHFLRMTTYLVCPLVEQDLKHTLLLRNVERIFMGDAQPEPGTNIEQTTPQTTNSVGCHSRRESIRGAAGSGEMAYESSSAEQDA